MTYNVSDSQSMWMKIFLPSGIINCPISIHVSELMSVAEPSQLAQTYLNFNSHNVLTCPTLALFFFLVKTIYLSCGMITRICVSSIAPSVFYKSFISNKFINLQQTMCMNNSLKIYICIAWNAENELPWPRPLWLGPHPYLSLNHDLVHVYGFLCSS